MITESATQVSARVKKWFGIYVQLTSLAGHACSRFIDWLEMQNKLVVDAPKKRCLLNRQYLPEKVVANRQAAIRNWEIDMTAKRSQNEVFSKRISR